MSSSRIRKLLDKINKSTIPALFSGGTAAVGSVILSRMGSRDHDALSAAGMATLGSIITSSLTNFDKINWFSLFNEIKKGGSAKYAAALLIAEAAHLLTGAILFLLGGKTLEEVGKNSADLTVGSIVLALPMAFFVVDAATKLLNDFEAQQKRAEEPQQNSTLRM